MAGLSGSHLSCDDSHWTDWLISRPYVLSDTPGRPGVGTSGWQRVPAVAATVAGVPMSQDLADIWPQAGLAYRELYVTVLNA